MTTINYSDDLKNLRERTLVEYFSAVNRNEPRAEALGVQMKDGRIFISAVLTYGNGHRTTALENLGDSLRVAYNTELEHLVDQKEHIVSVTFNPADSDRPIIAVNGVQELLPPGVK